jgi:hypothetical protein
MCRFNLVTCFGEWSGCSFCLKTSVVIILFFVVNICRSEDCCVSLAGGKNHFKVDSTKCKASFIYFSNCDSVVSDNSKNYFKYYFFDQSKGNITRREWDFGDGQTSSGKYAIHTYDSIGTYTVSLTVYCTNCEDSCFSQIKIVNQEETKDEMNLSTNVHKNKYILPCVVLFLITTTILIAFISKRRKL